MFKTSSPLRPTSITEHRFEFLRESGKLAPGAYKINTESDGDQYAYTDDGVGAFWYDTEAEMLANH